MKSLGIFAAVLVIAAMTGCLHGSAGSSATGGNSTTSNPYDGTPNVPISTAIGTQDAPRIIPDGSGGAFIAWTDGRFGFEKQDIFAERIDAQGKSLWNPDGVIVTTAPSEQV